MNILKSGLLVGTFIAASILAIAGSRTPLTGTQERPPVAQHPATQTPAPVAYQLQFFESAYAAPTCGGNSYRCGDLEQNGTCCGEYERCCYVSPSQGSCYCVNQGDKCSRY